MPKALLFAFPCACVALILKILIRADKLPWLVYEGDEDMNILSNNAAYTGFNLAMSFLFVFRTSQAYSRFWEGYTVGHRMYAEWFDFASGVVAFSRYSKKDQETTTAFHHRLVRLLSLLHAAAVASLRGMDGSSFDLIDLPGLDDDTIDHALSSDHPVPLIFQWIMELVVEGEHDGVLAAPAPIISRAFQELANGLVAYHDASKIQNTQFPLPYLQMQSILLFAHWCLTPFVMCQWVKWVSWVFFLTLIQALVFWSLYFTALEIEFPFKQGDRLQNYAAKEMHREFNQQLLVLIDPITRKLPTLHGSAILNVPLLRQDKCEHDLEYNPMTRVSQPRRSAGSVSKARQMIGRKERRKFEEDLQADRRSSSLEVDSRPGTPSASAVSRTGSTDSKTVESHRAAKVRADLEDDGPAKLRVMPEARGADRGPPPRKPGADSKARADLEDDSSAKLSVMPEARGADRGPPPRKPSADSKARRADEAPLHLEPDVELHPETWQDDIGVPSYSLEHQLSILPPKLRAHTGDDVVSQDHDGMPRQKSYGSDDAGSGSFEVAGRYVTRHRSKSTDASVTSPRSLQDVRRQSSMRPWWGTQGTDAVIAKRSQRSSSTAAKPSPVDI